MWPWPWPMTLKFNRVLEVVEIHVRAKFHQAECSGSWVIVYTNFLPYLAMVKNPRIRSCDLDLWPMTLKFSGFRAIVKIHVSAKFHQAECSGSWVIVLTDKKNSDENNTVRRYRADSNNKGAEKGNWWVWKRGKQVEWHGLRLMFERISASASYRPVYAMSVRLYYSMKYVDIQAVLRMEWIRRKFPSEWE